MYITQQQPEKKHSSEVSLAANPGDLLLLQSSKPGDAICSAVFEVLCGLTLPGCFGAADCSAFPAVPLHLLCQVQGSGNLREMMETGFGSEQH